MLPLEEGRFGGNDRLTTRDCTLSVNVAPSDVDFIMETVPHLVRQCRFPFQERVLVADVLPFFRRQRRSAAKIRELQRCCRELVRRGIIDRVLRVDYSPGYRRSVYAKHFDQPRMGETHNCSGGPFLAYVFAIEECDTRYLLHFDSDILLHQREGHSWIDQGIRTLEADQDVLVVCPLAGPPTRDGVLHQRGVPYERDPRGYYRFKNFTSRKYLIDRERFAAALPMTPQRRRARRRRLRSGLRRRATLLNWERAVAAKIRETSFIRADLTSPDAWSLHPLDHGEQFRRHLPRIIAAVEAGRFPEEQAGHYDLDLQLWLKMPEL
jgi:hypothetical protein